MTWTSMMDQMARLGYNTIRVPFAGDSLVSGAQSTSVNGYVNPDLVGLSPIQILDKVVDHAGRLGMQIILDRHRPSTAGQTALWYTPTVSEASEIADWKMLATRYAGNPTVAGADLFNEPHAEGTSPNGTGSCWGCGDLARDWRLAAQRIGNTVLSTNPRWFNTSQPTTTTGQNDGAELMVWLNHQGSIQPIGSKVGTATIAGATWDVWSGSSGWNVISYVRQTTTSSATFSVKAFWDDVVSRGLGSTSWYLTSIQAGFEPWIGGVGLALDSFSVSANGSTPTATPTPTPTPTATATPTPTPTPTGATGGCTASLTTISSWGGGFQASVTVTSTGTSLVNGWTAAWTFPSGQTISSLWSGVAAQTGSTMTVKNAPYNGLLAAHGSTTFGFIGIGSAPGSLTATCTNP